MTSARAAVLRAARMEHREPTNTERREEVRRLKGEQAPPP